jgi:hypothetical protein
MDVMNPIPIALPVTAFEIKLTIPIAAQKDIVWNALVSETSAWWPKTFLSEDSKGMVIEPRLGGRVFDDLGDGEGVMWYWVIGVQRPNWILLSGFYAPPYGGPGTSYLRLSLVEKNAKETVLEIHDASFGHVKDCDNEKGWREIFAENFAPFAAKKGERLAKR